MRHGVTRWNAIHRFQGQQDVPLSDDGRRQARELGQRFSVPPGTRLVSSDLRRAAQTASTLAETIGVEPIVDADLRETHAGQWEGLTHDEIRSRFGDGFDRWLTDPSVRPGGTGETWVEVADRTTAAVRRHWDAMSRADGDRTLVVVSHGGAMRCLVGALAALPTPHWAALDVLGNCRCALMVEDLRRGRWRVREYGVDRIGQTPPEGLWGQDRQQRDAQQPDRRSLREVL